jgi:hypothetical protein
MTEEHQESTPENSLKASSPIPSNPYTPGKLFGVAVMGAGCSLFLYYVFQQLEPEQKRRLRGSAVRGVKDQVRNWMGREDASAESEPK